MLFEQSTGFKTNESIAMKVMHGEGASNKIRLDEICPRASRKYTINYGVYQQIRKSIKERGLFEPIILNSILKYISSNGNELLSPEDRKYYEEQLANGRKYFVTSGNTRFFCFCSNCVDDDIKKSEDMPKFYELYKKAVELQSQKMAEGDLKNLNKFLAIDAAVVDDDYYHERARYNSANMDQRKISSHDYIANIIDEMKDCGKYQEAENKIKGELIDEMFANPSTAPKKAAGYFERVAKNKLLMDSVDDITIKRIKKGYTNPEDTKAFIKNFPADPLYGFDVRMNQVIHDYILETRNKNESISNIKQTREVFETYPEEIERLIHNGDFSFNRAYGLVKVYKELSKNEREKIIEIMIKEKMNFNSKKAIAIVTGKEIAEKKKEKREKNPLSDAELIDLLKDVKCGNKTTDEVWEYLENLNIV